ncbi:MAG: AbrB/MazE/SpoVT family DNA-binding domain-containing protein [Acidobacteriota bacterium]
MTKATVSAKGQISIPKAIRQRLNLKPGTQLTLDVQGENVILKRISPGFPDWRTARGMFRQAGNLHVDLTHERAEELARDDARLQSF